jgi:hypothetical protein
VDAKAHKAQARKSENRHEPFNAEEEVAVWRCVESSHARKVVIDRMQARLVQCEVSLCAVTAAASV